jgi:hypothetical protein
LARRWSGPGKSEPENESRADFRLIQIVRTETKGAAKLVRGCVQPGGREAGLYPDTEALTAAGMTPGGSSIHTGSSCAATDAAKAIATMAA